MSGTWDDTCPKCGGKVDCYDAFIDRDYSTDFVMDCETCGAAIQVDVASVPEFQLYLVKESEDE